MTEKQRAELSMKLALAIGWASADLTLTQIRHTREWVVVADTKDTCRVRTIHGWLRGRLFKFTNWNVVGPIAEKYNCFPVYLEDEGEGLPAGWGTGGWGCEVSSIEPTPQAAIASHVIKLQAKA